LNYGAKFGSITTFAKSQIRSTYNSQNSSATRSKQPKQFRHWSNTSLDNHCAVIKYPLS